MAKKYRNMLIWRTKRAKAPEKGILSFLYVDLWSIILMTSGNYRNVLKIDKDDFKRILTYQFTTMGVHSHFITILDIN